jgi:predicted histone-like DNA-binding protein
VAKEVEEASSLSKGDVTHVLGIFMTEMRKILVRGDRVKITGLGTFYMTVTSGAKDNPDDLTVRDIRRVNIRFLPDKALKLVNNALATTRSDNNVVFAIKGKEEIASGDNAGETVDTANTGEEDDDVEIPAGDGGSIDPNA